MHLAMVRGPRISAEFVGNEGKNHDNSCRSLPVIGLRLSVSPIMFPMFYKRFVRGVTRGDIQRWVGCASRGEPLGRPRPSTLVVTVRFCMLCILYHLVEYSNCDQTTTSDHSCCRFDNVCSTRNHGTCLLRLHYCERNHLCLQFCAL